MQFNRVNNKEHWRSLGVSGFLHMRVRQNSICPSFEAFLPVPWLELTPLRRVPAHHSGSFRFPHSVFFSKGLCTLFFLVVYCFRSYGSAFGTFDMLESSEVIISVPFSTDPHPPLAETWVTSAPAATSPSFGLPAQDLSQAFSEALDESLPHIFLVVM